jgi:proliferating cell nuclear antigen
MYKLSMLDINVLNISIPPADFQTVITMPSVDLQKIIRDMHNLADFIEIRNVGNQLTFSCKGDFCTQETVLGTDKNPNIYITNTANKQEIIQGVYSIKYLISFTKCTSLSTSVEMYIKNMYPLILCYQVANLGSIRMAIAGQETT